MGTNGLKEMIANSDKFQAIVAKKNQMPLEEYRNAWVLMKKKFFLIVLITQNLIIFLLFDIFAHLSL